ncbi:MAG: OPT/YSL family transporter [Patescibacteria group bacterium]
MKQKEITWQSVTGAFFISAIISAAYVYIVLKLGMGPNMSILAAFFGAIFLNLFAAKTRGSNAIQNNIIQTAATSATSTAFMCVVAAAFGYLDQNKAVVNDIHLTSWGIFTWLSCSGTIGVMVAALFRRYFMEDPDMIFADGVAAAETIKVLDSTGGSGDKIAGLGVGAFISGALAFVRDGLGKAGSIFIQKPLAIGLEWNLLSVGTGLIVGLGIGLSMLLGTAVIYYLGPAVVDHAGLQIVQNTLDPQHAAELMSFVNVSPDSLNVTQQQLVSQFGSSVYKQYQGGSHYMVMMLWFMWPATALMIFSALTAVLLKLRSIGQMFRNLSVASHPGAPKEEVPLRTIVILISVLTLVLAFIQQAHFHMPIWQTVLSVLIGFPLILAGVRVLGETNQGPVSLMANTAQAFFRLFSPHIGHNLVAAGMSGDINAQGEGTMQVYRTGKILGSTPRILTWVQFLSIPIGAAAIAIMYPILVARYPLGTEGGLAAPTGLKLANMAVLMSKGFGAFPPAALNWTIVAAIAGILLTIGRDIKKWRWLPSASAFGFALILPGTLNIPIAIGAIGGWIWSKVSPVTHERYCITLAAGFIAGEALIAGLILPVLFYFGIL